MGKPQPLARDLDSLECRELPGGWAVANVGSLFESWGGATPSKARPDYWGPGTPWISSGEIKTARISEAVLSITTKALAETRLRLCPVGSVLVVMRSGVLAHSLPVAITDAPVVINQDIKSFWSSEPALNEWLALSLRNAAQKILGESRKDGTTVQSVRSDSLLDFEVLIPPLAEQRRIVAKIEALLARVNAARDKLAKLPALLKRFRQSVLAAACSGRLTAEWREKNHISDGLDKVIEELQRRRTAQAASVAEKQRVRQVYLTVEQNDSDQLPSTWRFVTLKKLCSSFDYGTSAKSHASGSVAVLRMGNVQNREIDWKELVFTSDANEIRRYSLKPHTVLFNRTNSPELVGKTAIYRGERPAIFAGYLIRIVNFPELAPEYLNMCLNTSYARDFCSRAKTDGVSQSNINAKKLGSFEVPLCCLAEQHEIVQRVEALFKLAEKIERRVAMATARAEKLTQSILAKAFRGELVPTEAQLARQEGRNYESASTLLDRVSKQRDDSVAPNGVRRKKRAATLQPESNP